MEAELDDALQRIESKIKDKVSRQCAGLTSTRAMLVCKMCKVVQKKVTHTWHGGDTKSGGVQRAVQCSADDNASLYLFRF